MLPWYTICKSLLYLFSLYVGCGYSYVILSKVLGYILLLYFSLGLISVWPSKVYFLTNLKKNMSLLYFLVESHTITTSTQYNKNTYTNHVASEVLKLLLLTRSILQHIHTIHRSAHLDLITILKLIARLSCPDLIRIYIIRDTVLSLKLPLTVTKIIFA